LTLGCRLPLKTEPLRRLVDMSASRPSPPTAATVPIGAVQSKKASKKLKNLPRKQTAYPFFPNSVSFQPSADVALSRPPRFWWVSATASGLLAILLNICVFIVCSYGYVTEADRSRDMDRERTNLCMDRLVVVENLFGIREQSCFAAIDGHGMLVCARAARLFLPWLLSL
jgi:hypothetical protein